MSAVTCAGRPDEESLAHIVEKWCGCFRMLRLDEGQPGGSAVSAVNDIKSQ